MNNIQAFKEIASKLGYSVTVNVYGDHVINGMEQAVTTRDGVNLYHYDENRQAYDNNRRVKYIKHTCTSTYQLAMYLKEFKAKDDEKLNEINEMLGE